MVSAFGSGRIVGARLAIALGVLAASAGCSSSDGSSDSSSAPSQSQVASSVGSQDLSCAGCNVVEVKDYPNVCHDHSCWDSTYYRVSGCGEAALYDCTGSSCTRVALDDVTAQGAAQQLSCTPDGVSLTPVTDSPSCDDWLNTCTETWSFAATGCGQEALYTCANGCIPTVTSTITIDAALFTPTQCRSGDDEHEAFFGADLTDAAGSRLRLVSNVDGSTTVLLFPAGSAPTTLPASCAQLVLEPESDGGVTGGVTLDCVAGGVTIVGTLTLRDCA